MDIQTRIISFVTKLNWSIFIAATLLGFINTPLKFALGILCGGLLVTINFYLLRNTLYKSFEVLSLKASKFLADKENSNKLSALDNSSNINTVDNLVDHDDSKTVNLNEDIKYLYNDGRLVLNSVIIKYYIRFIISGIVIFTLINKNIVEPIGLIIGLSVVVVSIIAATTLELTRLIFKEAV